MRVLLIVLGKPKKEATIAGVRKMIVILNSALRNGVMWDTTTVSN
jgi:transposase